MKQLVIVESPAKAQTIAKYLGPDFIVKSSVGHIRDLAEGNASVVVEENFRPIYAVADGKKKLVSELRRSVRECSTVWLATDEDREGEAIAWHLAEVLGLPIESTKRIVFHEITRKAILHAVANPRTIDMSLVDAQQARRVLDWLVGYEVSPVLWQKVSSSARSAGRVQSVAVKLLVEREREITSFDPVRSYRIGAIFRADLPFDANLEHDLEREELARDFVHASQGHHFVVREVEEKPAVRKPAPPFTTSTLQQEASRKLRFNPARTMNLAQALYQAGMITYMRTDSVNLSQDALGALGEVVRQEYGAEYHQFRTYTSRSKGAQEAHEAIRPTSASRVNVEGMSPDHQRLYTLIRNRALASQMAEAKLLRTNVRIGAEGLPHDFIAKGEVVVFPGFLRLYTESLEDDAQEEQSDQLPKLTPGQEVILDRMQATERYSKHPPRYSEAALVKKLEDLGIGRPSTYSATIQKIQDRDYVVNESRPAHARTVWQLTLHGDNLQEEHVTEKYGAESRKLFPTDMGMVVTDYLDAHFPLMMQYDFTAQVEVEFDEVARGEKVWTEMLRDFYGPFHQSVLEAREREGRLQTDRELGLDPSTGRVVLVRIGKYGPLAQIGREQDGGDKPRFASLHPNQRLETITLDQALELFRWPRKVGDYQGQTIEANRGRFGPYIKVGDLFVSLKDEALLETIDQETACQLIEEKLEDIRKRTLRVCDDNPEVVVMRGRFGPYLQYKGRMALRSLKGIDWENMSGSDLVDLIQRKKSSSKTARSSAKPKPKSAARTTAGGASRKQVKTTGSAKSSKPTK